METILSLLVGAVVAILLVGIAILFYDEGRKGRDLRLRRATEIGRRRAPAHTGVVLPEELEAYRPGGQAINPLPSVEAADFSSEWRRVRERFGENPRSAIADADRLAQHLMEAKGYLEREAASVYSGRPPLMENYRRAHRLAEASEGGRPTKAELRRALVHFDSLFEELLETEEVVLARS